MLANGTDSAGGGWARWGELGSAGVNKRTTVPQPGHRGKTLGKTRIGGTSPLLARVWSVEVVFSPEVTAKCYKSDDIFFSAMYHSSLVSLA